MGQEHIEEYLGAIFRLRESADAPLSLGKLQEYFGFSPISIHEMAQKLSNLALVDYFPYRGVVLTAEGEAIAAALVRRHRIWERFLTDLLDLPWDAAHEVAGHLEHAAPEAVTERLSDLLGQPDSCPHGGKIPPSAVLRSQGDVGAFPTRLAASDAGKSYRVSCISPEVPEYLKSLQAWHILPGAVIEVCERGPNGPIIKVDDHRIDLPEALAQTIRVIEVV